MAVCPDCGRETTETTICTRHHFVLGGKEIPRILYGSESRPPTFYSYEECCDDCGVEIGSPHHRDCAIEQCPLCGDYAAVCHCWAERRWDGRPFRSR